MTQNNESVEVVALELWDMLPFSCKNELDGPAVRAMFVEKITAATPREPSSNAHTERPVCWIDILREWFGGERYARDYEYLDKNYAEQARRVEAFLNSRTALNETEDKA